jgi:hypothetical protein
MLRCPSPGGGGDLVGLAVPPQVARALPVSRRWSSTTRWGPSQPHSRSRPGAIRPPSAPRSRSSTAHATRSTASRPRRRHKTSTSRSSATWCSASSASGVVGLAVLLEARSRRKGPAGRQGAERAARTGDDGRRVDPARGDLPRSGTRRAQERRCLRWHPLANKDSLHCDRALGSPGPIGTGAMDGPLTIWEGPARSDWLPVGLEGAEELFKLRALRATATSSTPRRSTSPESPRVEEASYAHGRCRRLPDGWSSQQSCTGITSLRPSTQPATRGG